MPLRRLARGARNNADFSMTSQTEQFNQDQQPQNAQGDAENRFAVALARGEESFPVLQAFQSFLDQERERSRRRITTLSAIFIAALAVLTIVFATCTAIFFSHVMSRNEAQQDRMLDLIARGTQQPATPPAPAVAPSAPSQADIESLVEKMVSERILEKEAKLAAEAKAATQAKADSQIRETGETVPKKSETAQPDGRSDPQDRAYDRKRGIISPPYRRKPAPPAPQEPASVPSPEKEVQNQETATALQSAESAPSTHSPESDIPRQTAPKTAAKPAVQSISVKPERANSIPEGYQADTTMVQTENGVMVPLRTLLPDLGSKK